MRETSRHLVVGLVDTNLVTVDSSRGYKFVKAGGYSNLSLAEAAGKPCLLKALLIKSPAGTPHASMTT